MHICTNKDKSNDFHHKKIKRYNREWFGVKFSKMPVSKIKHYNIGRLELKDIMFCMYQKTTLI